MRLKAKVWDFRQVFSRIEIDHGALNSNIFSALQLPIVENVNSERFDSSSCSGSVTHSTARKRMPDIFCRKMTFTSITVSGAGSCGLELREPPIDRPRKSLRYYL